MATITKTSELTGITRTLQIKAYDQDDFDRRLIAWRDGRVLLEEALPNVSADAREFIKTGITAEEWDKATGKT